MDELLANQTLIFWTAIVLISGVPVVAHYWYKTRKAELEASLKREMIERGMSADEICKVLAASGRKREEACEEA